LARPLLALGQNWDWLPALAGGTLVLRLRPARGPRLVTFTEAGMLAKIGMNELRLGVCLNFLGHASDSPPPPPGIPVHCLLRAVLGCRSLEEAYKLVAWAPRSASANLLLAQHAPGEAPTALDLELTPSALARLPLADGILVHSNHFKDPSLARGCTAAGSVSTTNRNRVALELAQQLRRPLADPVRRMQRILVSRAGAPTSISKTATPESPSISLAGIVMDLSRNRLHLALGPPHQHPWHERPGV
jgi:isopenicillin-N N-acyltransferase-like protein